MMLRGTYGLIHQPASAVPSCHICNDHNSSNGCAKLVSKVYTFPGLALSVIQTIAVILYCNFNDIVVKWTKRNFLIVFYL